MRDAPPDAPPFKLVPPRHAMSSSFAQGESWAAWRDRPAALRSGWAFAAQLYAAVLALFEAARAVEGVLVYGTGGRAIVIPRAHAERLVARGKLTRAESIEGARAAVGLPPSITVTADTDHTAGAGVGEEPS